MKSEVVSHILQVSNRCADSELRYAGKSDETVIKRTGRKMGRLEEVKRRYLEGKG